MNIVIYGSYLIAKKNGNSRWYYIKPMMETNIIKATITHNQD